MSLNGHESHSPQASTKCKELAQKLLETFASLFQKL